MDQTAVAHIDPGRLHQPLADVGVPGRQPAQEQQVGEQIDVGRRGLGIDAQVAGELGDVEHAALMMGQHRPEATQPLGGDARPELGDVPLEVRADEVLSPAQAADVARCEEALGEATAHPEPIAIGRRRADFQHIEGVQIQIAHPAGQGLAGLPEQVERGGTEQQVETPAPAPGPPPGPGWSCPPGAGRAAARRALR